jgi:hypothetical protein
MTKQVGAELDSSRSTLRHSPEEVLFRVQTDALLTVLGRRKGERMLRIMAERLSTEEHLADVLGIRPAPDEKELANARREAAAKFHEMLPVFVARLARG